MPVATEAMLASWVLGTGTVSHTSVRMALPTRLPATGPESWGWAWQQTQCMSWHRAGLGLVREVSGCRPAAVSFSAPFTETSIKAAPTLSGSGLSLPASRPLPGPSQLSLLPRYQASLLGSPDTLCFLLHTDASFWKVCACHSISSF